MEALSFILSLLKQAKLAKLRRELIEPSSGGGGGGKGDGAHFIRKSLVAICSLQ